MKTREEAGTDLGRRRIVKGLGAVGLGSAVWQLLGGAQPARASLGSAPGGRPTTSLVQDNGTEAVLTSGPFQSFEAPAGTRIGLGLLTAGSPQSGPLPLIQRVTRAPVDLPEIGVFEPDLGVGRTVYRLLGALDTVRPVEVFGLSATVGGSGLEGGRSYQISWTASLRGDGGSSLGSYLERFHACVIGELAPSSTFTGQLSYVELNWAG